MTFVDLTKAQLVVMDWRIMAEFGCPAKKKIREKSRECHSHKPQPFQDTKRKRKQTKPNKSNKRTKSAEISFLSPKRGSRNAKRTEKHKNKITQGKT